MDCRITQWLEEEATEDETIASGSEAGEEETGPMVASVLEVSIQQNEMNDNPVAESSSSEEDTPLSILRQNFTKRTDVYVSKNGTQWAKTPLPETRTRLHNIRSQAFGPKGTAKNADSPVWCFELFFDDQILETPVTCTNIYIDRIKVQYRRERDAKKTDLIEMRALIGLLLAIGVSRSGRRNLNDFWDNSK